MPTAPLDFFDALLPPRFRATVDALRSDPGAKAQLDDVLGATGVIRFVIEGAGERWVGVHEGVLRVTPDRQALPIRGVFAFEAAAARAALDLLEESGRLEDPTAASFLLRIASKRTEKALAGHTIAFHLTLKDVPELGDVLLRGALGVDEPPAKPQFTAEVHYDDLEDMRAGDLTPQQLIGRIKLTGDASRAMALGMSLMPPPAKKKA